VQNKRTAPSLRSLFEGTYPLSEKFTSYSWIYFFLTTTLTVTMTDHTEAVKMRQEEIAREESAHNDHVLKEIEQAQERAKENRTREQNIKSANMSPGHAEKVGANLRAIHIEEEKRLKSHLATQLANLAAADERKAKRLSDIKASTEGADHSEAVAARQQQLFEEEELRMEEERVHLQTQVDHATEKHSEFLDQVKTKAISFQ